MVTIDLFHANTEEEDKFTVNSSKDLYDYILVQKQCREFKLIFENGKRISHLKISKIDNIIQKDFKDCKEIKVLLTTKQNTSLKNLDQVIVKKDFLNSIEKFNFNPESLGKIKLWYETLYNIKNDSKIFEVQKTIIKILENFYQQTLVNQENRIQKLIERRKKDDADIQILGNEVDKNLIFLENEAKSNPIINDLLDIQALKKHYPKFMKMYDNFHSKTESIKERSSISKFREKIRDLCTFPAENSGKLHEALVSNNLFQVLEDIKNKELNEVKRILIEMLKLDLNRFKEIKEEYSKNRKNNTLKIKELLTNQCISLKNEISKIDELELIHRSIKKDLDIFQIPKILPVELKQMQIEVQKRKEYEYVCSYFRKFFVDNVMTREEERRKEFKDSKRLLIKNALYKTIFENLVEKTEYENTEEFTRELPNLEELVDKLRVHANRNLTQNNKELELYYTKLTEINLDLINILNDKYKIEIIEKIQDSPNKMDVILGNISETINKIKEASVSISAPNFDISNLTINQSIYESQIKKEDEKNKYFDPNSNEQKITEGINNFVSVHKTKIYFFDKFFDYLLGYASKYKIKHNLNQDNPETMGEFVEKILSDHVKLLRERIKILKIRKND